MGCDFTVMDRQIESPRGPVPDGKLVYCALGPGSSMIGAPAPSLKLVLDGDERYEIDGRTISVKPGEFLYLDAGSQCIGTNRSAMTGLCLLLPTNGAANLPAGHGDDPVLGRALVLSTRASALGRTLWDYGRRIAHNPLLGPAIADELVARVEVAIAPSNSAAEYCPRSPLRAAAANTPESIAPSADSATIAEGTADDG